MTDPKSWIEERRAIHEAATEGPWVAEYSAETGDCVIPHDAQSTREAVAVTRLFHRTADANAIADAHNMFPRALDALSKVLGLCDEWDREVSIPGVPGVECDESFKVRLVIQKAIEGAIND